MLFLKRRHTPWIFAAEQSRPRCKLRSSDSRRCPGAQRNSFPESCSKVHGTIDTYISPFALSLRLMVDTHVGTRGKASARIAGCTRSVVLTNVRPKIRLTGPAFTSPPLQRSPATLSREPLFSSAFNFNTYVRAQSDPARALNNRRTHSQLETNENFAPPANRNTSVTVVTRWRCRLPIDARDLRGERVPRLSLVS